MTHSPSCIVRSVGLEGAEDSVECESIQEPTSSSCQHLARFSAILARFQANIGPIFGDFGPNFRLTRIPGTPLKQVAVQGHKQG